MFMLRLILAITFLFSHSTFSANKLLITHGTILTMKTGDKPFIGYVLIDENGKIKDINKGNPPENYTAKIVFDAKGKILLPGFISAHSHLSESAFRSLATDQYVYNYPSLEGWVGSLFSHESGAKDQDYYWFTLQGALDHLVHGITSVYNFTVNKNKNEKFAESQWQAELDSGIRFIHSFEPAADSSLKDRTANLESFLTHAKKDISRPTVLKLAYSGWLRKPEEFKWDAMLLHKHQLYSEIHFLESPVNKKIQQDAFRYIRSEKMLGNNVSFGHFIHTNDAILKTVAKSGSGMVWNPLSNGRLASGIVDIPKYQQMGIKIGMGVDGQGSADLPDPFENMRTGLYFIRAKYESAKILQPIDVLRFHTLGSAEVLGIEDKVGSLEIGKFGDVIVIDPTLIERGPVRDPYAAVVLSCNAMNIAKVYVGGDLLVDTYKLQKNNMKIVSREVNQRIKKLGQSIVKMED
jgi:cytosine/adenosine deaminase-related metal-dependent hydrolase